MIVIITLANKPKYLSDAIASVEAQTRRDFRHVVQMDEGIGWGGRYPPAAFWNETAKAANPGDYICWLSDDDLFLPNYIEDLAGYLDANPEIACCYGGNLVEVWGEGGKIMDAESLPREGYVVYNSGWLPACRIDGGQFMVRRSALDLLEWPWCPEEASDDPTISAMSLPSRYCDAIYMNKIANAVGIYPIKKPVMIQRRTPLSGHTRIVNGVSTTADWRTIPKWQT